MFSRRICLLQCTIAFFCAIVLSHILFIPHTFAATDPITITSQTATSTFPTGIDFQVQVQDSAGIIAEATLILSANKPHYIQVERTVPIATPQQTLTLTWHEDTTTSKTFVYPGTIINYKWQFHDNAAHWYTQDQQTLTVIDNRFNWQQLTQAQVQIHWYGQSTGFGQIVLSQAIDNIKRISGNLGGTLLHPINLWVYHTPDDFRGSLPPGIHEWVGGIAFPSLNEADIVVDSTNADTLIRDMPHELTHLVFHQLTEHGILAPLWLDEGLAVYNQTYREPDMDQHFKQALATHTLLRLNTISYTFPADADTAYLAYAQSWKLISYMYTTFGQAKMAKLISLMNSTTSEFNDDLKQALGEDQLHLENQWRIQLDQPSVLTPADMAQTPQPSHSVLPQPISTSDAYTPLLIFAGLLLIILPIAGLSGFFIYQKRRLQKDYSAQQAQHILSTTFSANGYQPYQQYHPYSQPQPPTHPAMPFESYGNTTIPPVSSANQIQFYTDPTHYSQQQQVPQQPTPAQEYTSQKPPKQAPQE
ncbi:MAG: hypothetical protein NVS4B12_14510 [Ktedonobacteraceae bacterium]